MRTMSIRARVVAVIAMLGVVGIVAAAASQLVTQAQMDTVSRDGFAALQLQTKANDALEAIGDQQSAALLYQLTADPQYEQTYEAAIRRETDLLSSMHVLAGDRPSLQDAIVAFEAAAQVWRTDYAEPVMHKPPNRTSADDSSQIVSQSGQDAFDLVRTKIQQLRWTLGHPDKAVVDGFSAVSTVNRAAFLVSILAMVIASVAGAIMIGRLVVRPLRVLIGTAQRVEAGEDVEFHAARHDEIGQLGRALERMRRSQRDQQRSTMAEADRAGILNRYTEVTSFDGDDTAVAHATLVALTELCHPLDGVVHVSNRSRDRAVPEGTVGDRSADVLSLRVLSSCPGVVRGTAYVSADVAAPLAVRCQAYPVESGTLVCVPLVALGEVVGAIHLHWAEPDALPVALMDNLGRIAGHAALTMANRRLVSALQGMASTDARTGLLNSRAFDELLEKELAAWRQGDEHAVLMIDIDHFKRFNDDFGHPAGDEALRSFASILRSCLREHDIAARYGGEEFVVLLPSTSATDGRAVAERIRQRVETTIIALSPGLTGRITVSIGLAAVPEDGSTRIDVLRTADAALYRAKQAGRNRVCCSPGSDRDVREDAGQEQAAEPVASLVAVTDASAHGI